MPRLFRLASRFAVCLLLPASGFPMMASAQWGRPLLVGPNAPYRTLADAARAAAPGATVRLSPGVYRECAVWTASNLTIQATPDTVRIEGPLCEGLGQFILRGSNITLDGLNFSGAQGANPLAAAVRIEGASATIRRANFRNNGRAILALPRSDSIVRIEHSVFYDSPTARPGIHVEARAISRLSIGGSSFERTYGGPAIRSAAWTTEITASALTDGSARSRLLIEIRGGNAVVRGNSFQKVMTRDGAGTAAIVIAAAEGAHPGLQVAIVNNSVRNDTAQSVTFVRNLGSTPVQAMGNVFSGAAVTEVEGPAVPFTTPPPRPGVPP